jgi:Flp pilus assembly protein TadG
MTARRTLHRVGLGRGRGEVGAATASLVVVFPALITMFMALVQWGLYFHAQAVVDAAAQDANRATQDAAGTIDDGRAVATQVLAPATGSGLLDNIAIGITDTAGTVRAEVRGDVRALVPLPGFDLTVEGIAEGPRERFVGETERRAAATPPAAGGQP